MGTGQTASRRSTHGKAVNSEDDRSASQATLFVTSLSCGNIDHATDSTIDQLGLPSATNYVVDESFHGLVNTEGGVAKWRDVPVIGCRWLR